LWVFDPSTGEILRDNTGREWPNHIVDVAWTPDQDRIILTDEAGDMALIDAETFAPVADPVHMGPSALTVQPGPDDHTAFVLVDDTPAEVSSSFEWGFAMHEWARVDLESGRVDRAEVGFDMKSMSVSPDRRHLVAGGAEGEVALVDTTSGELVRPAVVGHGVPTYWIAWSADGSRFATTGGDGSVVLWDGETGLPLDTLVVPEEVLTNVAFLPDGKTLLLTPYTDSFYRWDTSGEHAVEFACRAAAGDLDEREWEAWFGDRPWQETCPEP
jgi:WD40 repeat protein